MSRRTRKTHSRAFKAKVALAAIRSEGASDERLAHHKEQAQVEGAYGGQKPRGAPYAADGLASHLSEAAHVLSRRGHKIYPYLLKDMEITEPGQVYAADITYIPMACGFLYLVAVIDWKSRKLLSHRISNMLEADFCVDALEEAISHYGAPEVFNTDQDAQFTSAAFRGVRDGGRGQKGNR